MVIQRAKIFYNSLRVSNLTVSNLMFFADKEAPKVTYCPTNILKISDGKKAVTWVEATFSDNIKVTNIESSVASGDIFPLGTTNVHYTAKDAAGNSNDECKFYVQLKRKSSNFSVLNLVPKLFLNGSVARLSCRCPKN